MTAETYTNTSLGTARACLTKYDLGYNLKLVPDADDSEALLVGHAWHKAFHYAARGGDTSAGYEALRLYAPGRAWNEKLGRLYAAYQWRWPDDEFKMIEAEKTFRVTFGRDIFEGQIDGIIEIDGRLGILERKTAGEEIGVGASFWDRLPLDVQVGIYASACGFVPSFILYDVARKPTIRPKSLTAKVMARMRSELTLKRFTTYYGERFEADQMDPVFEAGRESIDLYGARLTADIGDRPEFYFQRREVPRTKGDFDTLFGNLEVQVRLLEYAQANGLMHRNPGSCALFGRSCEFQPLCVNNVRPQEGDPAPDGFHFREHLHPELAQPTEE